MQDTLNLPPFPPLSWEDGYAWTGSTVLSAWAGFQSRQGPYASVDSAAVANGSASLTVTTSDDQKSAPSLEQVAAYRHLLEQQEATRDAILEAVFAAYPKWQEQYGYDDEEAEQFMPDLESPEQLKALLGLSAVHVFPTARNAIAYVGFEFGCTWDDEHGLGAMTHAGRIVEVGGADTAILEWIATRDADKVS